MDALLDVTDANFDSLIAEQSRIVLDCWAPWCEACHLLDPVLADLARDYAEKAVFARLNADENFKTATRLDIMALPTLFIIKDGRVIDQLVGALPRSKIEATLDRHFQ